jgi:hypothetical protein
MLRLFTIISLLAILLTGCGTARGTSFDLTRTLTDGLSTIDFRKPVSLDTTPPEGPTSYRQGWKDGCESALASTNTNLFYVAMGVQHKYRIDNRMAQDILYKKAWHYAYYHCGYSMKALEKYNL